MDSPQVPLFNSAIRSYRGCWTCRVRRKKCDEVHPVCGVCTSLRITCHFQEERPEWMDGGPKQHEMAEKIKHRVKEESRRRPRGERTVRVSSDHVSATSSQRVVDPKITRRDIPSPGARNAVAKPNSSSLNSPPEATCMLTGTGVSENATLGRSDSVLLTFYLEHLFPFLFPFYSPSLLQGGKAWILEMAIRSPVIRQAILCQSSYFFSLAGGVPNRDVVWETVIAQTGDAFEVLRQALQVIECSSVKEHIPGAVRIMSGVMQLQRFEVAISSFDNCQPHLNAALALFVQLLDSSGITRLAERSSHFLAVMNRLGPSEWVLPARNVKVPSAEQTAFRFSSALLILDDIIASTVLQEQPRLYSYHRSLLGALDDTDPLVDLEAVTGCRNWALLQIGEIAVLDAWKQKCRRDGNLDVMKLVHRATTILNSLGAYLTRLETDKTATSKDGSNFLDILTSGSCQRAKPPASQSSLVTRVWTHAAHLYLFVVVSGWQPAGADVRYHVNQIIDLLSHQISPPALLRTMVWPFCVAGCLAESTQEAHLRGMVEALQPPCVFGTVRKALEIMESVWRSRDLADAANRDLAMCFRSQGDLVLLV